MTTVNDHLYQPEGSADDFQRSLERPTKRTRRTEPQHRTMAERWVCADCWLDGIAARISGRLNQFATVTQLDGPRMAVEFSWPAVDRIMQHNQRFSS